MAKETCGITGKQRHTTRAEAKAQRASLMHTSGKDRSRTNVIRCPWCNGYHVGRR